MNTRLAVVVLFVSSIGWGFTWLPIKALNEMGLDNLHLIFITFLSGFIVLLPWLIKEFSEWRNNIGFMLMIALAGGFANTAFQSAIYYGDVIRVMILFYLLPVWSVLGGRVFLKEKIDRTRLWSVLICLSGAFVILDVWNLSWKGVSWIDLLAIGAGMGLAGSNILFRFSQGIPVMSKVSATFIGCTVIMGVFILNASEIKTIPGNKAVAIAVAYGAVWITLISIGTQWAVTKLEAGRSSIILVTELVVAVVSVAILSNAELKPHELIGGVMVVSAALLEGARSEIKEA